MAERPNPESEQGETPEPMKLRDVLGSLKPLGEHEILPQVGRRFKDIGDGTTRRLQGSIRRYLDALRTEAPDATVEMLIRVASPLKELGPESLAHAIPSPVVGEADALIPDGAMGNAWLEAEKWLSDKVRWGWTDDLRMRPQGYEKGYPRWLFRSCLEIARRFALAHPSTTGDDAAAARFVASLDKWPGWECALPRLSPEEVEIGLPSKRFTRPRDEPRSIFVQRILGWLAQDVIQQVISGSSEDLRTITGVPGPVRLENSAGRPPSRGAEKRLVHRMFGLSGTRALSDRPSSIEPDSTIDEQTVRILLLLQFLSEPNPMRDVLAGL